MSIPLRVTSPDGTTYPSLRQAEKATGVNRTAIRGMLEDPTSGWTYEGELPASVGARANRITRPCLAPDGTRYDSVREAAAATGISRTTLGNRCRRQTDGWRYCDWMWWTKQASRAASRQRGPR